MDGRSVKRGERFHSTNGRYSTRDQDGRVSVQSRAALLEPEVIEGATDLDVTDKKKKGLKKNVHKKSTRKYHND